MNGKDLLIVNQSNQQLHNLLLSWQHPQSQNYGSFYNDFVIACGLDKEYWPWKKKKPHKAIYADIEIVSCTTQYYEGRKTVIKEFKDCWYYQYVGIRTLAVLTFHFSTYSNNIFLYNVQPARIKNSWLYTGRDVYPHDIIIL